MTEATLRTCEENDCDRPVWTDSSDREVSDFCVLHSGCAWSDKREGFVSSEDRDSDDYGGCGDEIVGDDGTVGWCHAHRPGACAHSSCSEAAIDAEDTEFWDYKYCPEHAMFYNDGDTN